MNGREFLIRVIGLAHRLRPDLPFSPDKGERLPLGSFREMPSTSGAKGTEGSPRPVNRPPGVRRRRQGFLADDVGITMYLGTRGGRGQ